MIRRASLPINTVYRALLFGIFIGLTPLHAYTPVTIPNGERLAYTTVKGVKEFQLTVDAIDHELAPGIRIKTWGYNGQTPGPVIEAVEGDIIRILVTNNSKETTAVHWHGLLLPNEMDGVEGLTQRGIPVGDTFIYEFRLKQHGTFMYYSTGTEMDKTGTGAMGFMIVHPEETTHRIDKDFVIFLNDWVAPTGNTRPESKLFTFNGKVYPATAPLVVRKGERVRIRFANVGQESHPIHLHGYSFKTVATDGGDIPRMAQWPETTVVVSPGQSRDIEFLAYISGDWALHSQRHNRPTEGEGPFGKLKMGGMFTVLKVRDRTNSKTQEGWYSPPQDTVQESVTPTNPFQ